MRNQTMRAIVDRMTDAQNYTIFVLGDSITAGFRSTDREHTYTAVFARGLAERFPKRNVWRYDGVWYSTKDAELRPLLGYDGPFPVQQGEDKTLTVVRSGIGGNTVRRMLNRKDDFIGKTIDGRVADLYTVMVGINDALQKDPTKFVEPDVFGEDLNRLLDELEAGNPTADIILMTPTFNDKVIQSDSRLKPYVDVMLTVAADRAVPVIDQHACWMAHYRPDASHYGQGDWLSDVEGDSCHPSNLGHEAIAKEMLRAMFET